MGKTANILADLSSFYFEDLKVGMTKEFSKTISEADIQVFAKLSGDENPLHSNPKYAKETVFKACIVYGMLIASFISMVIGTLMLGLGCIYVAQNLKFRAPVWAGEMVKAIYTVTELKKIVSLLRLKTSVFLGVH